MVNQLLKPYRQVIGMGILAGMRSASAPAIAGHILSKNPQGTTSHNQSDYTPSVAMADVLKVIAFGEFLADKLPFTPNRIRPVSIAIRCISGALAGAGIFKAAGKTALAGALLGGLVAGTSTFGSFYLRKKISRAGLGNFVSGIIEDAVVVRAGAKLTQSV